MTIQPMIKIKVNGEPMQVAARTLAELLIELGRDGATIATARNHDFVRANQRGSTPLHEADEIEILAPMQGG